MKPLAAKMAKFLERAAESGLSTWEYLDWFIATKLVKQEMTPSHQLLLNKTVQNQFFNTHE